MAQDSEIARQRLRLELLRARCELDRRELEADLTTTRSRLRTGAQHVRQVASWALIIAPAAGLFLSRTLRGRRLASAAALTRLAMQLPKWWPFVDGFLRGGARQRSPDSSSPPR